MGDPGDPDDRDSEQPWVSRAKCFEKKDVGAQWSLVGIRTAAQGVESFLAMALSLSRGLARRASPRDSENIMAKKCSTPWAVARINDHRVNPITFTWKYFAERCGRLWMRSRTRVAREMLTLPLWI
jgi:hypothetical protein